MSFSFVEVVWPPPVTTSLFSEIDIVFVHGLNPAGISSNAFSTWTHENGTCWPKTLLPRSIASARIILFGYNSNVVFNVSTGTVRTHAMSLIDTIASLRQDEIAKKRPIIFVSHSLGGIVVKQALVHAVLHPELYGAIPKATVGLMFFGTPHGGGNRASVAESVCSIISVFTGQPKNSLLGTLRHGSLYNEAITDDFNPQMGNYDIVSFFEERKTDLKVKKWRVIPQVTSMIVVNRQAAKLGKPGEIVLGMDADHRNICKFSGEQDDSTRYERVIYHLLRMVDNRPLPSIAEVEQVAATRLGQSYRSDHRAEKSSMMKSSTLLEKLSKEITEHFESLSSMRVDQHLYEVHTAQGDTFQWIRSNDGFRKTTDAHEATILHVTGKPGCGKTVLSKLIHGILQTPPHHCRTLFFAFNERDDARRYPVNLLASFISQFLKKVEFSEHIFKQLITVEDKFDAAVWNEKQFTKLLHLFHQIVLAYSLDVKLVLLVDALDECVSGDERRKLLYLFGEIMEAAQRTNSNLSFIFTSRPFADIEFGTHTALRLDLNSEEAVDQDLKEYISAGVSHLVRSRPAFAAYQDIISTILQRRAEKMYLLIELLLDLMHRHRDSSPISIDRLLNSLPSSLPAIYSNIWSLIPADDEPRARMIFSWILCAFRPFTIEELSIAIAKYDYDKSMQARFQSFSTMAGRQHRSTAEYLLDPQNNMESYRPIDLGGDLARLFGPLIHIEAIINETSDQSNPNMHRRYSPHVLLCHQTVKEYFINRTDFIDKGKTHLQMAILCARLYDGTIEGDPDTEPVGYDFDDQTINELVASDSTPYSYFWERHRDFALQSNNRSKAESLHLKRKKRFSSAIELRDTRIYPDDW